MDLPSSLTVVGCPCRDRITTSGVQWLGSHDALSSPLNVFAACDCPTSVLALPASFSTKALQCSRVATNASIVQHLCR